MDRRHVIRNSVVALGSLASAESVDAASPQGRTHGITASPGARIVLAEKKYFEAPGFVLLVYHFTDAVTSGVYVLENGGQRRPTTGQMARAKCHIG